jgi:hypothetical protein
VKSTGNDASDPADTSDATSPIDAQVRELASLVAAAAAPERVEIRGAWTSARRKTYASSSPAGRGSGPYVEVVDHRWHGTLHCGSPTAALAFLLAADAAYWVRSAPPAADLPVEVSMHARAGSLPGRATFTARIHGGMLPGVPFDCGSDPVDACALGGATTETGRAFALASVPGVTIVVLLVPKRLVEVGRNRLWRFREERLSSLTSHRSPFARGRSGSIVAASR